MWLRCQCSKDPKNKTGTLRGGGPDSWVEEVPFLSHRLALKQKRGNRLYPALTMATHLCENWFIFMMFHLLLAFCSFVSLPFSLKCTNIPGWPHAAQALALQVWATMTIQKTFLMSLLIGLSSSTTRKRHRKENPQAVCTECSSFLFAELGFQKAASPHCGQLRFLSLSLLKVLLMKLLVAFTEHRRALSSPQINPRRSFRWFWVCVLLFPDPVLVIGENLSLISSFGKTGSWDLRQFQNSLCCLFLVKLPD